jgi:hypothetical protein
MSREWVAHTVQLSTYSIYSVKSISMSEYVCVTLATYEADLTSSHALSKQLIVFKYLIYRRY